ncbi:caspase family protein [Nocardioides insulae]|uniref:caspase family protein n=1 Tax=Nocardioides insulae TaxID=394734 RepID=UPI00041D64B1|nr:caspase family protein [Nocardioides insulae]
MAASTEQLGDRRVALLVAVSQYTDPALRRLRSPAADAVAFRDLLADPEIGGFAVTSVFDEKAAAIRLAVEEFLTDRSPDDVVLVYLSCHGLVDLRRRLYFAARDTLKDRLAASGVEAHWLLDQLEDCRARRQVVVLDCCFSGAFARGAKGDTDLGLGERLMGQGRGRVVLTASRGTEYSFEGDAVAGEGHEGSVFTSALVGGITSGEADADGDGFISVDEAYAYAFEKVRQGGGQQTPQRWLYGAEGSILLARKPVPTGSTSRPVTESIAEPATDSTSERPPGSAHQDAERGPAAPGTIPDRQARVRRFPAHRWVSWLVAVAAAVLLLSVGALGARLIDAGDGAGGGGTGDGSSGATSSAGAANEFEVEAPWRLVVRATGDACEVTVTDEQGQSVSFSDLYGTKFFQMHFNGTVAWEATDPGCEVIQQPGADEQEAPISWRCCLGDSPAFVAAGTVSVEVLDFAGSVGCDVDLHAVEDGRVVSFVTVTEKETPTVIETYGVSPVYIGSTTCGYRISDAN